MPHTFERVAVLGLGLIGGSALQALSLSGLDVVGYDPAASEAAAAAAAGFPVCATAADAVREADLIMLAMPLPEFDNALIEISTEINPGAVVTDVGTLKSPVVELARKRLPDARFVGSHPLAGTERSGFASSDPLLFRDAPWALTLEDDTDLDAWLSLAIVLCDLGARPVPTTAAEQDNAVARVIGLPHVLAEALALTGLHGGELGLSLAAGSYTTGSRVARTRPELVSSWCDGNPGLVDALDDAIGWLTSSRDALAAGESILPLALAGNRARLDWENRRFQPVEIDADPTALLEHGRAGGWITAVVDESAELAGGPYESIRLLGMRPVTAPRDENAL